MTRVKNSIHEEIKNRYFGEYLEKISDDNPAPRSITPKAIYVSSILGMLTVAVAGASIPVFAVFFPLFAISAYAALKVENARDDRWLNMRQAAAESAFQIDIANRSLTKRFRTDLRKEF